MLRLTRDVIATGSTPHPLALDADAVAEESEITDEHGWLRAW
jgi:hypothetical protein